MPVTWRDREEGEGDMGDTGEEERYLILELPTMGRSSAWDLRITRERHR
jgi:hypothetical protein